MAASMSAAPFQQQGWFPGNRALINFGLHQRKPLNRCLVEELLGGSKSSERGRKKRRQTRQAFSSWPIPDFPKAVSQPQLETVSQTNGAAEYGARVEEIVSEFGGLCG